MEFILMIHSIIRWIIVLVAAVVLVKFALGWLQNRPYQPMDRGLMSGLTGFIDLQLLLGIILLIGLRAFTRPQLEHAFTMLIVVLVMHLLPRRWRTAADTIKFRNNLLVILGVLVLIVVGVLALPGNRWAL